MMKYVRRTLISLIVIAACAGLGYHIYLRLQENAPVPKFSFDAGKASGWYGRENINVQDVARTTDYKGEEPIDKLPIADLTITQEEPKASGVIDGCFVSYSYYDYALEDLAAAYDTYFDRKDPYGTLTSFEPSLQSLTTFEGEKEYQLQQYRFVIEGQDTLQGYQIGFIPLNSGYVRIEGVCPTYEDLALTLPALQSVQLLER